MIFKKSCLIEGKQEVEVDWHIRDLISSVCVGVLASLHKNRRSIQQIFVRGININLSNLSKRNENG